jgi:nuclear GTP-binding protein
MQKLQNQKAKLEEEQQRQKEARQKLQEKKRSLESLAVDANKKNKEFEKKQKEKEETEQNSSIYGVKEGSKRAYFREFKKILDAADVILEVLDARDPLGSRCPEIERQILKKDPNKKIILILNKIGTLAQSEYFFLLIYFYRSHSQRQCRAMAKVPKRRVSDCRLQMYNPRAKEKFNTIIYYHRCC